MKRLPWDLQGSKLDLSSAGFPACSVLVPETDAERQELLDSLDAQGVSDRMCFAEGEVSGTLNLPADPQWSSDGAIEFSVLAGTGQQAPMWFWVVEIAETPPRRYAWCSTQRDRDSAKSWS